MFTDIVELRDFYQTPAGLAARDVLRARIAEMWPSLAGERVLVLGYGAPLLRALAAEALACYAFMPAAQGVSYWPREGPNISCLVDPENLPLPDASIDRVIALHALEGVAETGPMLREIWRVMRSGARFLALVPNRRGFWAHSDRTPFGSGQPFSPGQIKSALHQQGFLVERVRHALYMPPSLARFSFAGKVEKYAASLFPGFGGVLMLEASKQLYAPIGVKNAARHRLVLPLPLVPQRPAPAGRIVENIR
ncbi:MAG: methyltransferase domain-containing protein [Alphaproteobacteria bacterium]|nr:methyltransferase domain-containing protein [Alphaproteobacteria bacterium]